MTYLILRLLVRRNLQDIRQDSEMLRSRTNFLNNFQNGSDDGPCATWVCGNGTAKQFLCSR